MYKNKKGITLIALVITIIVMLLLVGVTISTVLNGGLFEQAGKAASETNEALKTEGELANGKIQIGEEVYNSIEEYVNKYKGDNVEKISKETSYVGYYADVDGNGTADGVIYADLAIGGSGSNYGYSYSYEAVEATELKDYYVSGTHNGEFGNGKEVLTATGEGKDRFYVMALSDVGKYTWYKSMYYDELEETIPTDVLQVSTSTAFGQGNKNTSTMLLIWNSDEDESKSSDDLWAQLTASSKWFVPSRDEFIAFLDAFEITSSDFSEIFGLSDSYWVSSQGSATSAWDIWFCDSSFGSSAISGKNYVRLSATF